ncbi:MAG: stalk domain-containing protein [Desulfobulbus sp.]
MTLPVDRSSRVQTTPATPAPSAGAGASGFDASLILEQADTLLRSTHQYGLWRHIRQKDAAKSLTIARLVVERNQLLHKLQRDKSPNWREFDRLTREILGNGIMLPTSRQLAPAKTSSSAPVQLELPLLPPPAAGPPPAAPAPSAAEPPSADIDSNEAAAEPDSTDEPNAPSGPARELLHEDNVLILGASCPQIGLRQDVLGYSDGQRTLLPLGGFAQALDFPIEVDPAKGTAQGWFISENRTISVDAARKTIRVDGTTIPWDDSLIAVGEDDIYVDSRLLSRMLPLDLATDPGEMSLALHPREILPLQAQLEREQRRKGLSMDRENMEPRYPVETPPFRAASFPVMDVNLNSRVNKSAAGKSTLHSSYSVLAQGDLAYMGSNLFVAGQEDDPLDNIRLTLKRTDPGAGLLGAMKARTLELGDVSPVRLPVLGTSSRERGVMVSNQSLQNRQDFDTTRFEGNAQPGWDVELYRNNSLLQSTRIGGDGRYLFENIPVYFGPNRFEIVAHGPQGQRRVLDTRNLNIGSEMLKKGEMEYALSATQRQTSLVGEQQIARSTGTGPRLSGQVAYGLSNRLSATAGAASVEFEGERHNYLQAGLNHSLSSLYTSANVVSDSTGGSALSLQAQGRVGAFNLSGKHEIFSDFIEEANPTSTLEERTTLALSGRTKKILGLPALSYSLSRSESSKADGGTSGQTGLRLSTSIKGVHLANQLYWRDNQSISRDQHDGEFRASGSLGSSRIVAGIEYDIDGSGGITRYQLDGSMPLTGDIRARASLFHDTEYGNRKTEGEVGLDFDLGKVMFSPSLSYDSEGAFRAFAGLSFSLGKDPTSGDLEMRSERRSGQGAATALVYHDANNNQVFDQDDTPIPDAKVVVRQSRQNARTDEDGRVQFTSLATNRPVDVEIDPDSLADPFWAPTTPGRSIQPRPGVVQPLLFPVVTTGEVDGSLLLSPGDGTLEPLINVRLELRDENGETVHTTRSEYDGFFLFSKVRPGDYTLHIASTDPKIQAMAEGWSKPVHIGLDGTIARGNDVVLSPTMPPQTPLPPDPLESVPAPAESEEPIPAEPAPIPEPAPPVEPVPAPEESEEPVPVKPQDTSDAPIPEPARPVEPGPAAKPVDSPAPAPAPRAAATFTIHPLSVRENEPMPQQATKQATEPTPRPVAPPASAPAQPEPASRFYATQLASYTSPEQAQAGLRILAGRLKGIVVAEDFQIVRADLGERGIFYRVVYGRHADRARAEQFTRQVRARGQEALTLPVQPSALLPADTAITAAPTQPLQPTRPAARLIAQKYAAMQGRI